MKRKEAFVFKFNLPAPMKEIAAIDVVFVQDGAVRLVLNKDEVLFAGARAFRVQLNQYQTRLFKIGAAVDIYVRLEYVDGRVQTSEPVQEMVE